MNTNKTALKLAALELIELQESLGISKPRLIQKQNSFKEITFFNDYSLDPSRPQNTPENPYAEDKVRNKKIKVDLKNERQLYNIIKKRKDYAWWQPGREDRRIILRALNDID